jgi:hypothetical protein
LSTFGYIALVLHEKFERYLELVASMLHQGISSLVSATFLTDPGAEYVMKYLPSEEEGSDKLETLNELAEAICDANVGIIQGLRTGEKGEIFKLRNFDAFMSSIPFV